MTEAEWLACEEPESLLRFLLGEPVRDGVFDRYPRCRVTDRKLRLFAVGICRRYGDAPEERTRRAVEVAERYADGMASEYELLHVHQVSDHEFRAEVSAGDPRTAPWIACMPEAPDAARSVLSFCASAASSFSFRFWTTKPRREQAQRAHLDLLRDVFGNPFRPVPFSPEWRTDTAVSLAQQMYDARDFSAMPILADALQDAGCDSDEVLSHCRGPGPHVRGCWVVDLVLGKE
jgi:hypothetical protein